MKTMLIGLYRMVVMIIIALPSIIFLIIYMAGSLETDDKVIKNKAKKFLSKILFIKESGL